MKLKKSLIFILAFVFFCNSAFLGQNKYTVYATEIQDSSTDLVRDGGFEAATGAKKEGITSSMGEGPLKIGTTNSEWYYSSSSASKYKINLEVVSDENAAHSGSNALKATPGEALEENATMVKVGFQQRNITGLTVGKDYLFTTWVKTVGETTGGSLQVKVDTTELISWKTLKNATDWTAFTGEFEAGSTSIDKLNFIVQDSSGTGCYWLFDDISIVQVPILTIEDLNLEIGKSTVINVGKDDPHNLLGATPTYTWAGNAPTVATINESTGEITAVGEGTATITVTASYDTANGTNTVSATCTITVTAAAIAVDSVNLNKETMTLAIGEEATLTATVTPDNAADKTITWTSSNDAIATVEAGKVTAVAAGTAIITAITTNGKTATCMVTVTETVSTTGLVRDGGFEAATGAKKEGITSSMGEGPLKIGNTNSEWYFSSSSASKYKINLEVVSDENAAHSGSNALKAAPGEALEENATMVKVGFQQRDITGLTAGKDYLFTTWVKTVGETTGGSLQVKVDTTELISWKTLKNATDWTAFTGEFEAGSTSIDKLNFIVQDSSGTGCYWLFDDISIVQVPILTIENVNLVAGNTTDLTATVDDPHKVLGASPVLSWSSSAENVATVDTTGKITAVGEGTATITVTAPYAADSTKTVSATCTVTVTAAPVVVESVTLDKTNLTLSLTQEAGGEATLTATVTPDNATDKSVSWRSDKTDVATVDANGKVTAVAAGTATITATTTNGKAATCTVTVTADVIQVDSVSLDKTTLSLAVGGAATLTATIAPDNATNKTVSWSSDNTAVATVDANGKVTAVAAGTATITATTANGKNATCTVTVTNAAIVKDGSFEDTTVGTKKDSTTAGVKIGNNWWIGKSSLSGLIMNMEVVSEGRTAGTNAMKVSPGSQIEGQTASGKAELYQHYVTGFDVGKEYIITAYAKAVDTDDGSYIQCVLNGENKSVSGTFYASACREWTKITFTFTAKEADTNKYNDMLSFQMSNLDEGYWLLDDISIVQVPIITIDSAEVSLETGDTKEIAVTVDDPHKVLGDAPVITWSSADTEVVTVVEENGKVTLTAENPGTAKINAISNYADGSGSVKGEWTVKVTPKMIISNGDFASGTESWITGTDTDVTYTSDAEGRSDNALKVAKSDSATDAVSGAFGQLLDTKVTDGLLVSGSKYIVTAYAKPEGANSDSVVTVSWFDSASATAQKAEIQAGTSTDWLPVTFEFTAGDMSATGTNLEVQVSNLTSGYWLFDDISVKNAPYVSIPEEMGIIVGEKAEIDAKMIDLDYILDKAPVFNYSSADTSIATVDMRGRVTGVSAGTTTITVTYAYDSKYSATCTVTVSAVALTGIAIPDTLDLCEAQQKVLDVTFTPGDATNKNVTWTSSDASIAAVDENGLVTGIKAGTATITATGANNLTASCTVTVRKSTTLLTEEAEIQSTTYQEVVDSFVEFVTNNTGDEATYSLYEEPAEGILTVEADGSFSYIPRNGQVGDNETFTVIVNAGTEYAFLKGTIELVETIDDNDTDSDSDSDTDSNSDTDSDSDSDSDTDSDSDADSDSDSDTDSDTDTDSARNTSDSDTDTNTDSNDEGDGESNYAEAIEISGGTAGSTRAAEGTKTGDNSNMGLWLLLLAIAVAALGGAGYVLYRKKL